MILLDTNVVIDMINNSEDENWQLLQTDDVVLCGVVVAELYRGFKNQKEQKAVELFVNSVDCLSLAEEDVGGEDSDWKKIGLFIAKLKKAGVSVPFQDAVISFFGLKYNCDILTKDRHFELIKAVENKLRLRA